LREFRDHLRTGGLCKSAELFQWVFGIERSIEQHSHEHRPFTLHAVGPPLLRHS
jgi:hypothetical protein